MSYLPIDAAGNDNTIDGNIQVNSLNGGSIDGVAETAQALNDGTRADLGTFLAGIDGEFVGVAGGVLATIDAVTVATHPNLSREVFGKGAVHPNAGTISNRKDILLNNQQSDEEIALSIISALEFADGLSAVQNMSNGDVTGTTVTNIDSFSSRPDDIFTNTAQLNVTKRDHLGPAFTGAAEPDFVDAMVRQAGGTPGPTSFSAVVSDQTLMSQIAADAVASAMLTMHPNGLPAFVGSQTARDEMFASQTAMQEAAASQTAMQEVAASQTAMQEAAASQTAMQEVAASQTAMDEVGNSSTARAEVYASSTALSEIRPVDQAIAKLTAGEAGQDVSSYPDMATLAADASAMQAVAASQTAMQEVAASQTAMQDVAASQTAMQAIAASFTAMQEVVASQAARQEVIASQTAMSEIDQVDLAVRTVMCGTTSQDPANFADANAISQDASAMSEIAGSATTMNILAASQTAM